MFTNNYDVLLKMLPFSANTQAQKYGMEAKSSNGSKRYVTRPGGSLFSFNARIGDYATTLSYVYFGNGTNPATKDDYALQSLITSGLSASASMGETIDSFGKKSINCVYTLTNNSQADIIVGELGMFVPMYFTNTQGTSGSSTNAFLMLREVFGPITIQPSQNKKVNLTIKLDEVIVSVE